MLVPDRSQTFHFDQVFDSDANQESVYIQTVQPFVKYVKQGYNCTVFAYGQTGTGKTYTIGTEYQVNDKIHCEIFLFTYIFKVNDEKNLGLIPRALEDFFQYDDDESEMEIFVSFTEIYNEKVFDLLQNNHMLPVVLKGIFVLHVYKNI